MALPVYLSADAGAHPVLHDLATRLALPIAPATTVAPALVLEHRDGRLQIRNRARRERPWFVDFTSARLTYRRSRGGGVAQPLARAVGIRGPARPRVIDATAGWGRDAFVLASLGCTLTLIERDAVVAALLGDGLRRAAGDPRVAEIVARIRLHEGDAREHLRGLAGGALPEVVYLDPMYPARGQQAAVKKDLRLLRELVRDPPDDAALLAAACAAARERVVVKRPRSAAPLAGRVPDARITSPNTRYDLYHRR